MPTPEGENLTGSTSFTGANELTSMVPHARETDPDTGPKFYYPEPSQPTSVDGNGINNLRLTKPTIINPNENSEPQKRAPETSIGAEIVNPDHKSELGVTKVFSVGDTVQYDNGSSAINSWEVVGIDADGKIRLMEVTKSIEDATRIATTTPEDLSEMQLLSYLSLYDRKQALAEKPHESRLGRARQAIIDRIAPKN